MNKNNTKTRINSLKMNEIYCSNPANKAFTVFPGLEYFGKFSTSAGMNVA